MKNETARREIESLDYYLQNHTNDYSEESHTAMLMAIQALSQEPLSEIKENISKYMKKYPNHVGNIDFWNGFYACRNIVEHLDEDEQEPICDRDCEHCTWTECPIQPCDDAVSRAEAMTEIMMFAGNVKPDEENIYIKVSDAVQLLRELPPVTQKSDNKYRKEARRWKNKWLKSQKSKTGHCKDCKWWKDSDGAYRRGIGAESQCHLNTDVVYEGLGYCYMFEPQAESEGKE